MQQAVDAGADFIAISGQPVTAIETALAAAKAKDIPVFAMFGENEADPDTGVVAVVGGLNTTAANAENLADWVISDSKGEADALLVNLPDFTILQYAEQKMTDQFDADVHDVHATTRWRRRSPTSPPATSPARSCRTCSRTPT